jgi:hypothetical protein
MEIYVSPHTGTAYEIVEVPQSRTDYHVPGDGSTRYERQYIEYQFFFGGKRITSTYSLGSKYLSDTFGEIEGVYAPWEASPRD